ncbi:CCA tRNA nucleotidyltransferase [Xanthobacter sp. TB0136]|uniref:CCA tRNA nucleotidyltransferase n=1 Tax=Xanthobacter sp. TB0136 TaxID=3459177 RepID=UPI004039A67F
MADLKQADFWGRPGLRAVLDALNADGEEARVVGGAVRNALLGVPVGDVDIATTALPQEVIRRVEAAGLKAVPTGVEHGTVTVVANHLPYEVTTLREDVSTDGRHAVVRFGRDWAPDAARRDFTINALYATQHGAVIDLVNGLADIARRHVRFIGDAGARIREDYLRILRLFRFHAAYGAGDVDTEALRACEGLRAGLAGLSRERVGAEMRKLLLAPAAAPTLQVMSDSGLLQPLLAGIGDPPLLGRLMALEQEWGVAGDAMRHLAALAVRVPDDVPRLRTRLRLSNEETRALEALALPLPDALDDARGRALLYRDGPQAVESRVLLAAARHPSEERMAALHRLALQAARWQRPVWPVGAKDFIAQGLKPGPALGVALRQAEAAWIAADFPDAPETIAAIVRDVACRVGRSTQQD